VVLGLVWKIFDSGNPHMKISGAVKYGLLACHETSVDRELR